MTKKRVRSQGASWPPKDSLEYVRGQGFLQLLTRTATELTSIEEIGGAFALVLDWMERKCANDAEFLRRFPTEGYLKKYLRIALRNRARDVARRWSQSRPLIPLVDSELVARSPSPLEQVSNEELIKRVEKALKSLSLEQQELVRSIVIIGRSFRETASLLGIPVSTAHGLYIEAIREVERRIEDV